MNPLLLAYCDNDSVRPGESVGFKVSCEGAETFRADIVRLICCETAPEPPGFKEKAIATPANGDYPARKQDIAIGSCAVVPGPGPFNRLSSFTIQAMVWPTRPGQGRQALMGTWAEVQASGFALFLDERGALALVVGDGSRSATVSTELALESRRWYFVAASLDADNGTVTLVQEPLADRKFPPAPAIIKEASAMTPGAGAPAFVFAAWETTQEPGSASLGAHFDGKLERPRLADRALSRAEMMALGGGPIPASLMDAVVGAWDFSKETPTDRIIDLGANALHGKTRNLPLRGATGCNWTGKEWAWTHAPEQYGAIHFHADDLYDAGWETDLSFTVPADLDSGIYGARLRAAETEFYVPFYVRPVAGKASADVLFLVPTATYMAYGNNRGRVTSIVTDQLIGKLTVVDDTDLLMLERSEVGLATYDCHADGSSVCYSSRLRPITNHRPNEPDLGMAYNNFAADLLVTDWLEHREVPYDVMTDEDLHHEGLDALAPYRVVVTGTHPEYYSSEMLDALDGFLRRGGRLMYLGGNGFFWKVAFRRDTPGVIELRRAQVNVARWNPGPGQYFHSFIGEPGGLWRDLGRPPQLLTGVGFISQGFDVSSFYRRKPASHDPRVAFMFEGVDEDVLGDFGLMRGGAAGVEIDRVDARYGTPRHALVVAASENHSNVFEPFEEVVPMGTSELPEGEAVRADMVFFECPNGGAVFSTGSIAYAGSLAHDGYDNAIARITGNVLRRFRDPAPFPMPQGS